MLDLTNIIASKKFDEILESLKNQINYFLHMLSDVKFDSKAIFIYEVFSKTAFEGAKIASEVLTPPLDFTAPEPPLNINIFS